MATLLVKTKRISRLVDDVLQQQDIPEIIRKELTCYNRPEPSNETESIPFEFVHKVYKHSTDKHLFLHEVLEGSEVYYPPLKQPERNPELVARLERLKAEQENKIYREMTQNINSQAYGGESVLAGMGKDIRSVQSQLMGVFNVVLTVIGAFTFGFMASYYSGKSAGYCVVVGFVFGLITAAADLYFFIKNEL